jgi:hypothetical protein
VGMNASAGGNCASVESKRNSHGQRYRERVNLVLTWTERYREKTNLVLLNLH